MGIYFWKKFQTSRLLILKSCVYADTNGLYGTVTKVANLEGHEELVAEDSPVRMSTCPAAVCLLPLKCSVNWDCCCATILGVQQQWLQLPTYFQYCLGKTQSWFPTYQQVPLVFRCWSRDEYSRRKYSYIEGCLLDEAYRVPWGDRLRDNLLSFVWDWCYSVLLVSEYLFMWNKRRNMVFGDSTISSTLSNSILFGCSWS